MESKRVLPRRYSIESILMKETENPFYFFLEFTLTTASKIIPLLFVNNKCCANDIVHLRWGSGRRFTSTTSIERGKKSRLLGSEWRRRSEIKKLIGAFGNVLNWREQILLGKISAKMPDTRARGSRSILFRIPLLPSSGICFLVCVAGPGRSRPHRRLVWIHFSAKSILDRVYARVYVRWDIVYVCVCVVPRSRRCFSRFYRCSVCNCLFHVRG